MDRISKERRSWNMSRIKSENTAPERSVRSALHRLGFRFRLHQKSLPGKPDIVLPRLKTVILVHGCFWHRHPSCVFAYVPKTRQAFWQRKFDENVARDQRVRGELRKSGQRVVVIWECQTTNSARLAAIIKHALSPSRVSASPRSKENTMTNGAGSSI
jgi:DNA mismatch endonuclease (patch repair protein)